MRIRFTCKWAGRFSRLLFILAFAVPPGAWGAGLDLQPHPRPVNDHEWLEMESKVFVKESKDRIDGLSYIISGSLALIGGLAGQGLTGDPLEKGVYTVFQTIGVASIGYGVYVWKLGDDDRQMYNTLSSSPGLSNSDRSSVMKSYYSVKGERSRREKVLRAVTHGLIAAVGFYGASQQKDATVRNALILAGGVNSLAVLSFTF
jgi:hypothetical protein